ncbi:MAG TPA: tripartite tricarboxylate transporter substrate-binding protein, partial [Beijerinckiaceae bacterium]|nr:tripartite tricarboxylate transporter substrate-binding protein [Beijerinckiaceae bacterium]
VGGHVDGVCDTITSISGAVEGKQVKALAVASPVRLGKHPEVPTAAEAGLPEFQQEGWNAIFAPAGTPQPVIDRLNAALRKAVASPLVQGRLKELSALPASEQEMTPAHVTALVPKEVDKYRALLKD